MSALEDFQARYGTDWASIVTSEPFAAALSIATAEKVQALASLTDEEIGTKGHIILAEMRGHLKYESALLGLHEKKETVFQTGPAEDYTTDPIREAHEESLRQFSQDPEALRPSPSGLSVRPPKEKTSPPKKKPLSKRKR